MLDLAKKNNMSLTELSLAFVNQRPFVTSNIIGATTMDQLKENIGSIHVELIRRSAQRNRSNSEFTAKSGTID